MAAEFLRDYTETIPGKRMAAGAIFMDRDDQVLIVKPRYREDWLIPGGSVERNESPYQACIREVREELGIDLPIYQLLSIEYQSSDGSKTENLQFVFNGGVLEEEVRSICLPVDEIAESRFCAQTEAASLLNPKLAKRLQFALTALKQNRTIYVENKNEIK